MNNGLLDIDQVVSGRTFKRISRRVELVESTTSTNDHLWSLLKNEPADGCVVFAEHQSAGRGRMGRSWHSPRGASVMLSVLVVDSTDTPTPSGEALGVIAGIATAAAINETTGIGAQVAWPNDIVVGGRKLAGILIESRALGTSRRAYAVGIGVNCLQHRDHFPVELRSRATSIDLESRRPVHREAVAGALLSILDAWLSEPARWEASTLKAAFTDNSLPLGRSIRLRYQDEVFSGQVVDLDPSAGLVVQLDNGGPRLFPTVGTTVIRDLEPSSGSGA